MLLCSQIYFLAFLEHEMKAWERRTRKTGFLTDQTLDHFMKKIQGRPRNFLNTRQKDLNKFMKVPASWIQWFDKRLPTEEKVWYYWYRFCEGVLIISSIYYSDLEYNLYNSFWNWINCYSNFLFQKVKVCSDFKMH